MMSLRSSPDVLLAQWRPTSASASTSTPQEAIIHAFRETGQAISFTSIILSLGFLIFVFSLHQGLSNFGVMSAVAFIAALLADLFLLPSLCLLADLRFSSLQPLGKET